MLNEPWPACCSLARSHDVRGCGRTGLLWLALLALSTVGCRSPSTGVPAGSHSGADAGLRRDLGRVLASRARYVCLPPGVNNVVVSPRGEVFLESDGPRDSAGLPALDAVPVRAGAHGARARLLRGARVLGFAGDGSAAVVGEGDGRVAILPPAGPARPVDLPWRGDLVAAAHVAGKWVFYKGREAFTEGHTAAWTAAPEPCGGFLLLQDTEGRLALHQGLSPEGALSPSSWLAFYGNGSWSPAHDPNLSTGPGRTRFLRTSTGGWVAVRRIPAGDRPDLPPKATAPNVVAVLAQEGFDSALAIADVADPVTGAVSKGLYWVHADGRAELLTPFGRGEPAPSPAPVARPRRQGGWWVFLPQVGLGFVHGQTFTWSHREADVCAFTTLCGEDQAGRLYFRHANPYAGRSPGLDRPRFWRLDPSRTAVPASVRAWPIDGRPTVDADGRLWFLHVVDRSTLQPPDATPLANARTVLLSRAPEAGPSRPARPADNAVPARNVLCSYRDGEEVLYRGEVGPLWGQTVVPAAHGAIVVAPWQKQKWAVLVADERLYSGRSLHDLATRHFEELLACAATGTDSGTWHHDGSDSNWRPWRSSVVRTGDTLWVSDMGVVEAYRAGQSLSVRERLASQRGAARAPGLFGPVDRQGQPALLLLGPDLALGEARWLTLAPAGIALDPLTVPGQPGDAAGTVHRLGGLPVLADRQRGLYLGDTSGGAWRLDVSGACTPIRGGGQPALALADGGLVVRVAEGPLGAARVVRGDSVLDLRHLTAEGLVPVGATAAGRLVCAGPGGIAWVRLGAGEGAITVERRCRVDPRWFLMDYLGEAGDETYWHGTDGRSFHALAIPAGR